MDALQTRARHGLFEGDGDHAVRDRQGQYTQSAVRFPETTPVVEISGFVLIRVS